MLRPAILVRTVAAVRDQSFKSMLQASAQSKLVKTREMGAFSLERRQFWKWITMPTIT
jgi:hypothetical protein